MLKLFVFMVVAAMSAAQLHAQEAEPNEEREPKAQTPGPRSNTSDQRLEQIEKQLRELIKAVNDLRDDRGTSRSPTTRPSEAAPAHPIDPKWLAALKWRSIGPAGMGGRIVDFAVLDSDPNMYWVATASGGLLKTINNGVS